MSQYLAAQITAFLTAAAARRDERGQTTAEYIGIMVVIVAIIGTILAIKTNVADGAKTTIDQVFKSLQGKIE
ncbi:hypothetical protein [Nocardioides conyzicola]|uniref:Flp family type IVb pilin n=1 Tax=Nocardioides conyzicola TaxID=1651781 RepID=A0ABP8XCJ4_9ACTN